MGGTAAWAFGTLAVACAGCLAAPPSGGPGDPDGDGDTIHVDRTPDVPVPDEEWVEDSLVIEPDCTIGTITVDVYIVHSFRGDVEIAIEAPEGAYAQLKLGDLDDRDDVVGNYPETLEPVDSLAVFSDLEARGTWNLYVEDIGENDAGTLQAWGVNLTCL